MSKKVKILCNDTNFHGKKMNLPGMNNTEIGSNGEIEVPEEIAEQLTALEGWSLVEETKKSKKTVVVDDLDEEEETEEKSETETEEEENEDTEKNDEDAPDEEQLDKEMRVAMLRKFKGDTGEKELKALATRSNISKTVIGKAKGKTDLINMILNKLSVQDKVELLSLFKTEE